MFGSYEPRAASNPCPVIPAAVLPTHYLLIKKYNYLEQASS